MSDSVVSSVFIKEECGKQSSMYYTSKAMIGVRQIHPSREYGLSVGCLGSETVPLLPSPSNRGSNQSPPLASTLKAGSLQKNHEMCNGVERIRYPILF